MNFRLTLENLETGEITYHKTRKELGEYLKIPYHQVRSIFLSDDKLYLHPHIKELRQKYKITEYSKTN